MSSSDPAEVTFEKVKRNGAVVKKRQPTFRDGDWKVWLEWLLCLSEYYVFMGYAADDEEDQVVFVEDIQVLLVDEDLQQFNGTVTEESILLPTTVALVTLQRLTEIHCPDGTRGVILDDMSALKNTRNASVRGMGRLSRSWEYNDLVHQFELIERTNNNKKCSGTEAEGRARALAKLHSNNRRAKARDEPRSLARITKTVSRVDSHGSTVMMGTTGSTASSANATTTRTQNTPRNPESPAYRPRRPNNRGSGTNKNHNNGGGSNDRAFAAMQEQVAEMTAMIQEMKRRQEEELNALRFYRQDELSVMIYDELVDDQPADDESAETLAPLRQQRAAPSAG
ncbi:unnamed protein product [Phytophthora fragariaefolia]|uniref:Unnamed protein product n=1 Tax=Phytophthora fragariaefolia TaxID=1490495 RepID=A0A9W6U9N2_9STRA|nr:unnamed protein product [Phytophthora fragariaefolia]